MKKGFNSNLLETQQNKYVPGSSITNFNIQKKR